MTNDTHVSREDFEKLVARCGKLEKELEETKELLSDFEETLIRLEDDIIRLKSLE